MPLISVLWDITAIRYNRLYDISASCYVVVVSARHGVGGARRQVLHTPPLPRTHCSATQSSRLLIRLLDFLHEVSWAHVILSTPLWTACHDITQSAWPRHPRPQASSPLLASAKLRSSPLPSSPVQEVYPDWNHLIAILFVIWHDRRGGRGLTIIS